MSQGIVEPGEGQGNVEQETQGQETGTSLNPAWNDLMSVIPSQLHSQVTPHLQQWDKNYQDGIGKVHSEYEPYKPFLDNQIEPQQLAYGLQLLDAIENRPQEIYEALAQHLGLNQEDLENGSELEQGQEPNSVDIFGDPRMQQLQDMVTTMANHLVQQGQQTTEQQEDAALEQEFNDAKEKYGEFDEAWVMSHMLSGNYDSIDEAVQAYHEFVKGILANANRPGPKVLSNGGQTANPPVASADMSGKDRRNLVVQMLQNAQNQS